ncbi:MAG: CHAP domain-containing protein [Asticcacaulis sp.]|nr:CHAP domain-containing protein [Asticcacaulis sp.]
MKKTVSALVFAAFTLCAAPSLYAKTTTHKSAKPAATQKVSIKSPSKKAHAVRLSAVTSRKSAKSGSPYLQCVTFARSFTGMQIFGDAWTWWEKATGRYDEGHTPKPGAVLVFKSQGRMTRGHVAVVSQIITERYIQVTHANWSPIHGRRGQVEDHVNVMDVSDKGDWSKVKVWYGPLNDFGTTTYVTYGFIYQDTAEGKAAAQEVIAKSEELPDGPAPQQIAAAEPAPQAELPASLKTALTPGNDRGFLAVKANNVAAHVTGPEAAAIVARIDADAAATATPKPEAAGSAKAPGRP